jgi:hypothetical protein
MAETEYPQDEQDDDAQAVNVEGNPEPSPEEIEAARAGNEKEIINPDPFTPETGFDRDPATMSEHERNLRQREQYGA